MQSLWCNKELVNEVDAGCFDLIPTHVDALALSITPDVPSYCKTG